MKLKVLVLDYLGKARKYSNVRFIFEFSVVAFILKIISAIVFSTILLALGFHDLQVDIHYTETMLKENIVWTFVSIPLFAAIETLIGQALFTFIVSRFTKSKTKIIVFSAIGFALLHWDLFQIAAIWPVAFVLSWIFVTKKEKGFWLAFFLTTTVHTLHNALSVYLTWMTISH